jgi:hypothetical protein
MGIVARRSAHLTAVSQRRRALVVRRALSACAWLLRNIHTGGGTPWSGLAIRSAASISRLQATGDVHAASPHLFLPVSGPAFFALLRRSRRSSSLKLKRSIAAVRRALHTPTTSPAPLPAGTHLRLPLLCPA